MAFGFYRMVSECLGTFVFFFKIIYFLFAWFWNPPAPTSRWWMGLPITLHTATPSCQINCIPFKGLDAFGGDYRHSSWGIYYILYQPEGQNLNHKPDLKWKLISTHQWQLHFLELQNTSTHCVGAIHISHLSTGAESTEIDYIDGSVDGLDISIKPWYT